MAGKRSVLQPLTTDAGRILNATHGIEIAGTIDLLSALKTSALVLKHRQNKDQAQHIVVFVGSPITHSTEELIAVAKQLRMANISVDVVNFGELEVNTEKIDKFIENVNKGGNSHHVPVPPGPHMLSDCLISSVILQGEGGAGMAAGGAAGGPGQEFEFGIDPNLDPELAEAIKESLRSLEHDRQKEAAVQGQQPAASQPMLDADMDEELRQALQLSMDDARLPPPPAAPMAPPQTKEQQPAAATPTAVSPAPAPVPTPAAPVKQAPADMMVDDDELQQALLMSVTDQQQQQQQQQQKLAPAAAPTGETKPAEAKAAAPAEVDVGFLQDPDFLTSLLTTLPGVNPDDPSIKEVMANLRAGKKEGEAKEGEAEDEAKKDADKKDGDTKKE
eukprot:TRINITY_DN302_c0_g1_i1.p1 TRINITY_DN302_c0_g1~~TRINITY_DN302_c0_g1_i1.p1  ORF type:complete len:448 (+),score=179.33 TRINITY_DN302_c0_g1_i1:178-1344(+)